MSERLGHFFVAFLGDGFRRFRFMYVSAGTIAADEE